MASMLRRLTDPGDAARELVAEARARGGNDNITVVVVDVVDDGDAEDDSRPDRERRPIIPPGSRSAPPSGRANARRPPAERARRDGRGPRARSRSRSGSWASSSCCCVIAGACRGRDRLVRTGQLLRRAHRRALTIYKGRPGGLLWFQPTVVDRTTVTTADRRSPAPAPSLWPAGQRGVQS